MASAACVAALVAATSPVARATAPYGAKPSLLQTPWTSSASSTSPLPDYPRPQLARPDWLSLNGRWQYEQAGRGQRPAFGGDLAQTILVPFPPQSPLSGIERGDSAGWYRRKFRVPAKWATRHVILNFGAVSWASRVYVNGGLAGAHRGDYDGFSLDITRLLHRGENELLVGYQDPFGLAGEPVGKQSPGAPAGFLHTASSGIWQTVWLEPVATEHVSDLTTTPDLARGRLMITAPSTGPVRNQRLIAEAYAGTRLIASSIGRPGRAFALPIAHPHLWSPGDPYLYGLRLRLLDGHRVADAVRSYFGMRSITLGRVGGFMRLLLNGRFVFQSGALAQGYWPDGIYTAPTDAALRFDLEAAKRLGYNMVREHVKVESQRWYYWADKLGLLVWQDMPNLPVRAPSAPSASARAEFRRELSAIVAQHRSSPSIAMWIPFNEGWGQFDLAGVTAAIRRLDPTRPVDSQSGSANCCAALESAATDVRDSHLYSGPYAVPTDSRASVIGEYGGVLAFPPPADRWPGQATSIGSPANPWPLPWITGVLRQQYAALGSEMRARGLSGAVFTELAACEQELGILAYDRRVYTIPPSLVRTLNHGLIAQSGAEARWAPPLLAPPGATGEWRFDERAGVTAADSSDARHPLLLSGGAGWTSGVQGSALSIGRAGAMARASAPLIDTTRSFTVSAWLRPGRAGQSATAISEPGAAGSSFSLGIETSGHAPQARPGEIASGRLTPNHRTWWTFLIPDRPGCTPLDCGVGANMHYDDGRSTRETRGWHHVTGVYDRATQTLAVFVDGAPEDVEHITNPPAAIGSLTVGAGSADYAGTDAFIGAIDDLRIYARALSASEVWRLYVAERAQALLPPQRDPHLSGRA